ncbi:energy transducer TonB [Maribacter sp. 1_MG-2023]|uniref:energy transducer TonB n=1 Tax=Maribacter sp. 1_MG-2023 TaxID=3062677 RepID=UPI0026E4808E|nr:energy transducer TonB [Maribacter sp. 1_MG-2023]MDO6472948.1 energy transducer TonB [Maribacter sp. 1_MG-2023]
MKIKASILLIVCTFISMNCFSQDDSIYFPQEEIVIDQCADALDKNDCLSHKIEDEVLDILEGLFKKRNQEIDTLKARITFELNDLNQINDERTHTYINDKKLNKKFTKELNQRIAELHVLRVDNKKPDNYRPKYFLNYDYLTSNNQLNKIPLDSNFIFKGGVIEETPLFPNQPRVDDLTDRRTFTSLMQKHIGSNFIYPKEAIAKKVSGRVSIMFYIDKEGNVGNIKTKGSAPILENEARRIISLLPKFQPGRQNGAPKKIPFSIPIIFKL